MISPFKTLLAYRTLTSLIGPLLPLWLRYRAARGKEDTARLVERMGRTPLVRPEGELIWLHGASVGETQMLRPVIDQLLKKPDRHVLITSGTRTSAELLKNQLPARAIHQYVPLDTPKATARFVSHWSPDLAVFVESELWPNLIWTTERANIPLALINARMSERSLSGWQRRLPMARSVIGAFDLILAADKVTANGLSEITGQTVAEIGSLKFDAAALTADAGALSTLQAAIGNRSVWLAASTHEAEEEIFHRIHETLPDIFMLWVPRHPERGPAIANRLKAPLRSSGLLPTDTDTAYVMDTMGEMGLALELADVCVMGGSFHSSLMGHNPLEAARAGVPVISGPFHASFADLYRDMKDLEATIISDEDNIVTLIQSRLAGGLDDMANRAMAFAASQSGALDTTVQALEELL